MTDGGRCGCWRRCTRHRLWHSGGRYASKLRRVDREVLPVEPGNDVSWLVDAFCEVHVDRPVHDSVRQLELRARSQVVLHVLNAVDEKRESVACELPAERVPAVDVR